MKKLSLLSTSMTLFLFGSICTPPVDHRAKNPFALSSIAQANAPTLAHEKLRMKNTFKSPEEVVAYYCARDASGFVWSGLLEIERKAFTLWADVPSHDSFFIASTYQVLPPRYPTADTSLVTVEYQISAMGDAHGTQMPVAPPKKEVVFQLKKVSGAWKIERPLPSEISPIVLQSKFPTQPQGVAMQSFPVGVPSPGLESATAAFTAR